MSRPPWTCGECEAVNRETNKFCAACGSPRNDATPAARVPWESPSFKPSQPDDRCDVPGCEQTVRQHIQECLRLTERVLLRAVTL